MQEERKRSNSVLSSGSIISTASSNSHKRNKNKKDGLHVAGMKLGSNRKGYIPSKYEKSPFINAIPPQKPSDASLSTNSDPNKGGRAPNSSGASDGGVPLSMAARKKEI